jgi:tetratricopeptide (TPR) repeat protein
LSPAAASAPEFDAANKLYEQGRYAGAAAAYQALIARDNRSGVLYFNLGNAWFKAGQIGRAIAGWRRAEQFQPRDPALLFNLEFARRKIAGTDHLPRPAWERSLLALNLNEWTLCAVGVLWLWFGLLALRELRPAVRPALRGYTATAGGVLLLLGACVAASAHLQLGRLQAVVVVPEALARLGPVEEAQVKYHYRDGTELLVLDQKSMTADGRSQTWFQVAERDRSPAWLKSDQIELLR